MNQELKKYMNQSNPLSLIEGVGYAKALHELGKIDFTEFTVFFLMANNKILKKFPYYKDTDSMKGGE